LTEKENPGLTEKTKPRVLPGFANTLCCNDPLVLHRKTPSLAKKVKPLVQIGKPRVGIAKPRVQNRENDRTPG
jgi:hypothetical protein